MAQDVANLISTLAPLLLDKKTSTTKSISPDLTAQFNQLFSTMMPQAQTGAISEDELNQLLQSIMTQGQRSFAPNQAMQAAAGGYNSTGLEALRGDAMAKATDASLQAMVNAKLAAGQNQNQTAQILSQLLGSQAAATGTTNATTPAGLGSLAAPLAGYSIIKQLMGDGGLLGKKASGGSSYSIAPANASLNIPNTSGASIGNLNTLGAQASVIPTIATPSSNIYNLLGSSGVDELTGFGDIGEGVFSYNPASSISTGGAGASSLAADFTGTASGSSAAAGGTGAAGSTVAGTVGAASGMSNDALLSWMKGGLSEGLDWLEGTGTIGSGISSALGSVGDAASSVGEFFTPQFDIPGLGVTGVPILAGMGNFMQGDYAQGAGDIGATMALNAIPGIGTALALISGFTSNGVLDDWFGIDNCYITTATMVATGNSDDNSYELTTMRKFRDDFMKATPAGKELVANYYEVAPKVVAKLSSRSDAKEFYADIYNSYLVPAIAAIETGDNYKALSIYRAMSQHAEAIATS